MREAEVEEGNTNRKGWEGRVRVRRRGKGVGRTSGLRNAGVKRREDGEGRN